MRFVLREKSPYYCYEEMVELRQAVIDTLRDVKRHPRVISLKELKMLFRIANHFNPQHIMQVGTCYGMTASSMLDVSSQSCLWLYEPHLSDFPVVTQVLAPYLDSIECYDNLEVALTDYSHNLPDDEKSFVLVNLIPNAEDLEPLKSALSALLSDDCVIVIRNIHRSDDVKSLWRHLKQSMVHGQSFTNEQIGVIVAKKSLNLEHFFLWF